MVVRRSSHKVRARPAIRDGQHFDSQKEARYYDGLRLRQKAGDLVFFLRQVPFHLPGGIKYVVDFVEFLSDGTVRFVDVKGHRTPEYIRNKKQVQTLYPIDIEEA